MILINSIAKFQIIFEAFTKVEIKKVNFLTLIDAKIGTLHIIDSNVILINFENKTLKNKLILSDSKLPDILTHALIMSYRNRSKDLFEIANELVITNPLNYNQSLGHRFYHYKLKRFILETILEQKPELWSSLFINNKVSDSIEQSEDILKGAKFDPTNVSKNSIGKIYKYKGSLFLKLRFQIIFSD